MRDFVLSVMKCVKYKHHNEKYTKKKNDDSFGL